MIRALLSITLQPHNDSLDTFYVHCIYELLSCVFVIFNYNYGIICMISHVMFIKILLIKIKFISYL